MSGFYKFFPAVSWAEHGAKMVLLQGIVIILTSTFGILSDWLVIINFVSRRVARLIS